MLESIEWASGNRMMAGEGPVNIIHPKALNNDNRWYYSVIMIRTQISLSRREYEMAKREARRLGISLAELLRRSLRTLLPADPSKPWMKYAGMVETGDPRSSRKIDDVIYGQKD